jgi:sec-independent protein translocase protein TatA
VPFGVNIWEILILLLIALLLFGPKRLPEMGRSLGRGLREFKDSLTGTGKDDEPDEVPAELPKAAAESRDRDPVA